jgi:hypothetical protein
MQQPEKIGNVQGKTYVNTVAIRCMIQPSTPGRVVETHGIETTRPHEMLMDRIDSVHVKTGYRGIYNNRVFLIKVAPEINDATGIASHEVAILEEITDADRIHNDSKQD